MSAWAGRAGPFRRNGSKPKAVDPAGFAERRLFGRYLGEILDRSIGSGYTSNCRACDRPLRARATAAMAGPSTSTTDAALAAAALVLAIGNQEPERSRVSPEPATASSAIRGRTRPRLRSSDLGCERRRGAADRHRPDHGRSCAVTGRGRSQRPDSSRCRGAARSLALTPTSSRRRLSRMRFRSAACRAMWRWLRRRKLREVGWRAAVDSLRPHSHALWQASTPADQRRFLRHARPWWDVHRHRIAPQVADNDPSDDRRRTPRDRRGPNRRCSRRRTAHRGRVRRRGAERIDSKRFAYAFNCTGPLHAIEQTKDPLLRSLLDSGAVRARTSSASGSRSTSIRAAGGERLWALGPLTKGRYWEIIAVPDIREQAAAVADDIARELKA